MNNNSWFKKQKPMLSMQSMGGGAAGYMISTGTTPITATGGTKATPGDGYIYHLFNSPANFVISAGNAEMDVLIVGGGGGGGLDRGGGGGAGGFRPATLNGVTGTHPVSIGEGGAGDTSPSSPKVGIAGEDTTFTFDSTAYIAGGGGGGSGDGSSQGGESTPSFPIGGSGGGSTGSPIGSAPWPGGNGGLYGNPGKGSNESGTGGGGGGAGSGGPNAPSPATSSTASTAGDGKTLPWIPTSYGVSGYFAGGGGGGGRQYPYPSPSPQGTPSAPGGGGRGGQDSPAFSATDGTANTGSGGGGGDGGGTPHRSGGDGADGAVLIRYEA